MASLEEENAKLEALRAYFASDDHIRERAAIWRDVPPEQCFAATSEECATAEMMLARLEPSMRERAVAPAPLPSDTLELLARLWEARPR